MRWMACGKMSPNVREANGLQLNNFAEKAKSGGKVKQ